MMKKDMHIWLDMEDYKALQARARARGCSLSTEIHHMLRGPNGEDPRIELARLANIREETKAAVVKARASVRAEAIHYKDIMHARRCSNRFAIALIRAGKPVQRLEDMLPPGFGEPSS